MNDLVVVALSDELHLTNSALGILKIILFYASDYLFKCMIHDSDHKVTLLLLESC